MNAYYTNSAYLKDINLRLKRSLRRLSIILRRDLRKIKYLFHNVNNLFGHNKAFIVKSMIMTVAALIITVSLSGIFIVNASDSKAENKADRYYTSISVKPEQTLWDIAEKYCGNEDKLSYINEIMSMNNMDTDTIYSGCNILIYYYSDEVK